MTRASTTNTKLIERFLRAQHYRHTATVENYTGLLRNFNDFVARHGSGASPTVSIVQEWLKERSLKWAAHILYHRACLVERYVNWLEGQGVIAANPFADESAETNLLFFSRSERVCCASSIFFRSTSLTRLLRG